MTALATVEDVQSLGVTAEDAVIEAMLAKASARFRSQARNPITLTDHAMVLRATGGYTTLPHTPVVEVSEVRNLNMDGSPGAVLAGWTFDGIDTVFVSGLGGLLVNGPGFVTESLHVEWSAGYAEVPEDVRWAVASMVERAASGPAPALAGETIGDYSWRGGGYTASGAFSMSADEMATAAKYRPRSGDVRVRAGY